MTKVVTTPYGVNIWKSIRALWSELKAKSRIKVLDGNKTSFWKNNWHEVGNLEMIFPAIFNLVLHQQKTVADMWTPQGRSIIFRRQINDWELRRVADFFSTLEQFTELQIGEDVLWWQRKSSKGLFMVNAAYKLMNQSNSK